MHMSKRCEWPSGSESEPLSYITTCYLGGQESRHHFDIVVADSEIESRDALRLVRQIEVGVAFD